MNVQQDYEENNAEFAAEIGAIEAELRLIESDAGKMDSFIRFAELRLVDMSRVWEIASPEQRQRVQNLLFRDGLDYLMRAGFLNRSKSCLFNAIEHFQVKMRCWRPRRDLNPCYRRERAVS